MGEQCGNLFGGDDLVGTGLIDPRLKNRTSSISTRIVNRPRPNTNAQQTSCPTGQKTCCYDSSIDLSVFGVTCISPDAAIKNVPWTQGCSENVRGSSKQCGTRQQSFFGDLGHGTAAPGEFPWTCLHLKQNDLLKVRVGEWDASGFKSPEQFDHAEYTVVRILKHPQFNANRLDNDLAILYTDRDINLNNPNVNTACLPSCDNQFDFLFSNGTGVRCHVAGWGKDEVDGQFQFIQ